MKMLSSRRSSGAIAGLVVAALLPAGAGSASAAPDGRLSGRVRDQAGHTVAGAAVRLTDGAGVTAGHDTSDDSGRYSVTVAAGTYDLSAVTDGPAGDDIVARVRGVEVGPATALDVVVIPADVTFSGTVRDATGAPLELYMSLEGGAPGRRDQMSTGPDGAFSLSVPPGTYRLFVSSRWPSNSIRVVVADLQLMTDHVQDLTLPFTDVSVNVRDDDGAPVAGGRAYLRGDCDCLDESFPWADTSTTWGFGAVTDGDGNAVLRAFAGKALLATEPPPGPPALQRTTQPVTVPVAGVVRVVMPRRSPEPPPPPMSTLRGRLLDPSGRAHAADLRLQADKGPAGYASFADDGSFTLSAPPGRYDLRIEALTDTYVGGFDGGDDGIPGLEVVLPGFDLTGDRIQDLRLPIVDFPVSVLDRSGRPLAGVAVTGDSHGPVELFPGGWGQGTLLNNPETDGSGTAHLMTFEGATPPVVAAGLYDVIGRTTLRPGTTSAVIQADAPVLRGSVRDRRGPLPEPARPGAWVSFHPAALGKFAPWPFHIGPDTTYTLQARRGMVKLYVSNVPAHQDEDGDDRRGSATLPTFWTFSGVHHHTGDATVDLTIPDAAPGDVVVTGPDGHPLDGTLEYRATTLEPVTLAPDLAAASEARATTTRTAGRYQPLLFGPSTLAGWFSAGGFHFHFSSLPISPGGRVALAVADDA
ncbi:MAG: carboxypeptidase-like regulatory domain-containing protein, partial [Acidimicrobiia bacterium]